MCDISIVIPNFKRVEELKRAVLAIAKQSFNGSVELVVVDDCSPNFNDIENSLNKITFPEHITLVILRHIKNSNAASARNTGIKKSQGEYIALLDSDDEWHLNYLESQYKFHKKSSEVFFSYSYINNVTENGSWSKPDFEIKDSERMDEYIFLHKQSLQTSGIFGPRHLFESNLFDPSLKAFQDYSFCINAQHNGCKFRLNEEALVTRYISWLDGTDHVGRKLNSEFLQFWLNKHSGKMSSLAISSFRLRFIHLLYESKSRVIINIFKECKTENIKLAAESLMKTLVKGVYNTKLLTQIRLKIKN